MLETRPPVGHSSPTVYLFGPFSLDLGRACLMRDQKEVKLRRKSFEVLRFLVENRGRLIPKSELIQAVWPDTFITDDSLVQCVRDVRRALNDSSQEYVKTVTGRGYIFEAVVTATHLVTEQQSIEEPNTLQSTTLAVQTPAPAPRHWYWFIAFVLLVSGFAILYPWSKPAATVWRSVPLTSYPGIERNPALSPDGNFVAFTWNGQNQDNFDIYVLPIKSGRPQRLTIDPAEDISPAWSPDRRTISFLRRVSLGRSEVILIPAVDGSERRLT